MAKRRVFVDTNIIIEAFRTGCWTAICAKYSIETVEKVVAEALTPDPTNPGYVEVDQTKLQSGLVQVHSVSELERVAFALQRPDSAGLDDGEKDLLAWLYSKGPRLDSLLLLSTADKAAVMVACKLDWFDNLASLQQLAKEAGVSSRQVDDLRKHFKSNWLETIKVEVRLN